MKKNADTGIEVTIDTTRLTKITKRLQSLSATRLDTFLFVNPGDTYIHFGSYTTPAKTKKEKMISRINKLLKVKK